MKQLSYALISLYTALVLSAGGFLVHLASAGEDNLSYLQRAWTAAADKLDQSAWSQSAGR